MHNAALGALGLDWIYVPFSVDPGKINSAVESIRALDLVGVNVTVPLKELIAPLLDAVDPVAAGINSVNTIVNKDGILTGYSTDGPGLLWDVADKGALPSPGSPVLVLGAGGSARSVIYSLAKKGFAVTVANRTSDMAVRMVREIGVDSVVVEWTAESLRSAAERCSLVINTSALGMDDQNAEDLKVFASGFVGTGNTLYDLVYSPPETGLMKLARKAGATAYNGLGMLVRQGALSLHYWTGLEIEKLPVSKMESALAEHLR